MVALSGWFLLVAAGTFGVALWFAYRITRHLAALERVAATIDADGVVPQLPESGPAELKATARAQYHDGQAEERCRKPDAACRSRGA
jgi:hypothetical protein